MIDKATRNKLKAKANELSDICVTDGEKFAKCYDDMYNSGEFNCGECFIIARLVDLYTAIKQGIIDKTDGAKQQSEIFKVIELEEDKNVDKKRIDEIVKLVGLENRIKDKVSKYSLGMRQRLGIAQAILHKPKLLILDEPTNGLDPEGIKEVKVLLKKLAEQENMAILISSHNLAELDTFCNKISIIKNGEIVETNDIDTFKKDIKNNCYILEVEDSSVIGSIIDYKMDILTETEVRVYIEKEQVPLLIKELVLRNIKIYNVSEENLSLEDAFLKKTGGNVIE